MHNGANIAFFLELNMISISALLIKQEREYIRLFEFGTMEAASRVAEDKHELHKDSWAATSDEDML